MKTFYKHRALTLLLLPGAIIIFLNSYVPMFGTFIAFKNINFMQGIWKSPWTGLSNFEYMFQNDFAWIITRNTVLYSLAFLITNLIVSVIIALALQEIRAKWLSKTYQTIMILPNFLSMVIVSYLVYAFLEPTNGFFNAVLLKAVGHAPIDWYNDAGMWPYIIVIVNAWKWAGIGAVIYLAALAGIDPEYYEAARMDGASRWQQVIRISLPLIRPIVIITTLLSIGSIFRTDFGLFYQVTADSPRIRDVTETIDTFVFRSLKGNSNLGMSSAAALYQSIVGFVLILLTNAAVRKINKENALF